MHLADFAKRVDLPETDQLAALLLRGNHLGTELVGSLALQAEHLRVARRQSATIQANKTPGQTDLPDHVLLRPGRLDPLDGAGRDATPRLPHGANQPGYPPSRHVRRRAEPTAEAGFSTQYIVTEVEKVGRSRENTTADHQTPNAPAIGGAPSRRNFHAPPTHRGE